MNIFYLDSNPKNCAQAHVDKHVVKMILEYSQLLSTAHRVLNGRRMIENRQVKDSNPPKFRNVNVYKLNSPWDDLIYSATHINHPSAVWVRESAAQYYWLYSLLRFLHEEYTARYGKVHASKRLLSALNTAPPGLNDYGFRPPPQAMPEEYKTVDTVKAYRNYYREGKSHLAKWKIPEHKPAWY